MAATTTTTTMTETEASISTADNDTEALMEPIDEDFWEERRSRDQGLSSSIMAAQTQVIEWPTAIEEVAVEEADVDARIARDMSCLTCQERDYILDDIHGVSDLIVETPELLTKSLQDLESLARNLPNLDAYNVARIMDARYVENPAFRLRFLRAERFDAKKAALRLVRHFQVKLDLFGKELLVKDITQDDLDQGDLQNLYCGHMQILPLRDRAGRHIVCWMARMPLMAQNDANGHDSVIHKLRRTFYTSMVNSADLETQRNGVIGIAWFVGPQNTATPQHIGKQVEVIQALPIRVTAFHFCHENVEQLPLLSKFKVMFDRSTGMRTRAHQGNHLECKHSLQTFGIPSSLIPIGPDGEPTNKQHVEQWEKRRRQEQQGTHHIGVPASYDVLLGKGKMLLQHPGNVKFRTLIDHYLEAYQRSSKYDKTALTEKIVDEVYASNGRFLKDDGEGWMQVGEDVARSKVGHCFRDQGRKLQSKKR